MSSHRRTNISHNNKKTPERRPPRFESREKDSITMTTQIKKFTDKFGMEWVHMPNWEKKLGDGKALPEDWYLKNPKLVGLVSDVALGVALNKDEASTLATFMHAINNYSAPSTKTPVSLKWKLPERTRKEAIELLWQAKEYPDEKAVDAIAKLCLITRKDLCKGTKTTLCQKDIQQVIRMVDNAKLFFESRDPGRRNCIITVQQKGRRRIKGTPDWISDNEIWELKSSRKEPLINDYLQLLGYMALAREQSKLGFDIYGNIELVGIYSSKADAAWSVPIKNINQDDLDYMAYEVLGLRKIGGE